MTKVFSDSTLKPTRKLIMLALADTSNDNGISFPNYQNIMEKTSLSRQSVNDNIKQLIKDGFLFKKNRNRRNGSRTSNKYLIYPNDNREFLDEEDYLFFEDLFNPKSERCTPQSQRDVHNPKSERCTPQSQRDVPPPPTQSQRGVPLEPSLNINHHCINHHLYEKLTHDEISLFYEYLELRKSMEVKTTERIINRLLDKYFEFGRDKSVIENAITSNWKDFYKTKQQTKSFNAPIMQQLNTDVNIWDAIEAQTEIGTING